MTTKFAKRCTSLLAGVAIVVLGAIIVVVWVQFSQSGLSSNQQYNVVNRTTNVMKEEHIKQQIKPKDTTKHIEETHLEDLGISGDVEIVKPLKIEPVLHGHDILYDLQRNKHDKTVLKHHSGHFRHKSAEVWDPHPQYEIDAFGRKLLLQLEQNHKLVSPNLHVTSHLRDNHIQKIRHNPKMADCFYNGKIKGDNESSISVSLCDGMTGYIKTFDSTYYIEPAEYFENGTLGSLMHRMKRLPHPSKENDNNVIQPEEVWENSENNTIIEDEFPTAIVAHRPPGHAIKKREIVVDEETKVAYINTCDIDTEKEPPIFYNELSRTTRDIQWSSFTKSNKEFFVKVLVVADESMIKYHSTEDDLMHYILILMSHVALLFKDATIGNAVSLAVVQIEILRSEVFPASNSQDMLRKFCDWQNTNIRDKTHDVALLFTRNTICKNSTGNDTCTTLGVAEVGSMCRPSSCAIIRDKGLSTSYTIAHEIGHVLSMPHDEDRKCEQYNKGYTQNNIMNKMLKNDTKPFMWSACSRHFVTDFLDSNKARCLNNPPAKDYITPSYTNSLPGDKFEVNRQCELEFGPSSKICPFQPPCGHLWCTTGAGEGCKTQWSPWAEGTRCGPNSWCFQRKCIEENREDFTPIDGGWGPWQEFGPCSRTCGGGIKISIRNCDSPKPINGGSYCIGESVRYASCYTMDCETGTDDFRAVQCAAFNGITRSLPNLTNAVEWIPKYGLENPDDFCRLYCRPKNSSAYYLLKDKVLDGTKCGLTSFDICISGVCRQGGCDNKLDSKMMLDDCGYCGGDNSRCQEISGTYNKPAETSGYNTVVRIPKGSSNVNITQDPYPYPYDENYLALRDGETGKPILNGNYLAVTHEHDLVFGSLIITYSGTNATVEWITTPKNHKLTKDLVLEVLSVGKLTPPHITYRYVISKDEAPSYAWKLYQKQWSKCDSICEGKQYRKPVCVELNTGNEVPNNYCDAMDESGIQKQECNTHCELTWNIASKGVCSTPCGKGVRPVYYNCMKVHKTKPNYSEIVNEKHCGILPKPPTLEGCNTVCNSTRWDYSIWSECTKTCGGGIQRRTAKCMDNNHRPIDDSYCNNSEKVTEQICNTEQCPSWIRAESSPCSTPCGGGYINHTYYCVLGGMILENACDINTRPPIREACNEQPCGRWAPLDTYHMCSVTCGEGVERRRFACKKFDSEDILNDIYCRDMPVPNESRVCYRGSCDKFIAGRRNREYANDYDNTIIPAVHNKYSFRWTPIKWSLCSQTCDGGISTEIFHCLNELGEEDESMCNHNQKPTNIIQCNDKPCPKWKTGDWSPTCDFNCERQRQVRCMDYANGILEDNHCDISRRPEKATKCKLTECPHASNIMTSKYFGLKEKDDKRYNWKVGAWKSCSNTCGKGTRRRHIDCEDKLNDITVVDSLCRHLRKPKATRPCERYNCKYAWIESYWSPCSTTCGPGIQKRNVTCHKVHHGGIIDPVPLPDIYVNKIHHKNYCSLYDKPPTTTKCQLSHCTDQYVWHTGPWKQCSQKCGKKGRQVRVVNCVSVRKKEKVSRRMCRKNLRPMRKRKCNQGKCIYKTCKEIKHYMGVKENKDYVILIEGRLAQIYCYKMDTPEPEEYITLHPDTSNYAEIYDRRLIDIHTCPYNGQRRDNCRCDHVGADRSGFTNFWKVRVNITSMKIIGDDYTFSKQLKGTQIAYGTAGDCYSSIQGCAQGRFSIDLKHTSFKLTENVRWEEIGPYASSQIHRTVTGASGKCGGYCGNCIPDPSIGLSVEIT